MLVEEVVDDLEAVHGADLGHHAAHIGDGNVPQQGLDLRGEGSGLALFVLPLDDLFVIYRVSPFSPSIDPLAYSHHRANIEHVPRARAAGP